MEKRPHKLFDRIGDGFSYMPSNAEGWGCLFIFAIGMLIPIGLGTWIADAMQNPLPEILGWIFAGAIAVAFLRFCRRHS